MDGLNFTIADLIESPDIVGCCIDWDRAISLAIVERILLACSLPLCRAFFELPAYRQCWIEPNYDHQIVITDLEISILDGYRAVKALLEEVGLMPLASDLCDLVR